MQPKAQPEDSSKSEKPRYCATAPGVAIFALGNMVELALEAANTLEKPGISTAVINARWIKPLDTATLEFFARGCEVVCTMEDHVLPNGFGCSVMEHLSEQHITTPVVRVGWPDQFIEHGTIAILRKKHGISAEAAVEKILSVLPASPTNHQGPFRRVGFPASAELTAFHSFSSPMSKDANTQRMEKIVSLCKRQGLHFPILRNLRRPRTAFGTTVRWASN